MRLTVGGAAAAPVLADAALGVGIAVGILAAAVLGIDPAAVVGNPRSVDAGAVALAVLVAAAVIACRRYPVAAVAVLNAACLVWFLGPYPGRLVLFAPLVGCFTLAAQRGWRWGAAGAAATAVVQIVAVRVVLGDTGTAAVVPLAVLLAATAASAGAAVGYNRALLAATRAELARETRSREERARWIAAEERLRIARELHDVIGHAMATVSVQAGVGLHVLERRPEQAREALAAIKAICDDGLTDVKTILGILRADPPAGDGPGQPRSPRGGLDRLTDLIEVAERGGLRVERVVDGDPGPLPAPVDLAAYRIIQEALTNVLRHAGAHTVRVVLEHEPSRLVVLVRDDGTGTGPNVVCGYGIDGMRERARALGGGLTAAPHPDGGFEVRAELPVPQRP